MLQHVLAVMSGSVLVAIAGLKVVSWIGGADVTLVAVAGFAVEAVLAVGLFTRWRPSVTNWALVGFAGVAVGLRIVYPALLPAGCGCLGAAAPGGGGTEFFVAGVLLTLGGAGAALVPASSP